MNFMNITFNLFQPFFNPFSSPFQKDFLKVTGLFFQSFWTDKLYTLGALSAEKGLIKVCRNLFQSLFGQMFKNTTFLIIGLPIPNLNPISAVGPNWPPRTLKPYYA